MLVMYIDWPRVISVASSLKESELYVWFTEVHHTSYD